MKTLASGSVFKAAWFLSAALLLLPLLASSCSDEPLPDSPVKSDQDRPESSVSRSVRASAHAAETEQARPQQTLPAETEETRPQQTPAADAASNGETVVFPANAAGGRINSYYGKESVYSDGNSTPDSVALLHIPDHDIVDYIVPEGYTAIANGVFDDCKKLESITIPDSITLIKGGAFNDHKTLKRVSLPAGVSIGGGAFSHCEALERVTVRGFAEGKSAPENAEIGEKAFAECRKLTHVEVPDGVKSIGVRAFYLCLAMKTIRIPDSVESIGHDAFWNCNELEDVTLSDNHPVSIGYAAFEYCYKLRHFRLPPGTEDISEQTFHCSGLMSFEASEGLKKIGEYAFGGCNSLRDVKLPDSLETIGYGAFYNCIGLSTSGIPANLKRIGVDAFGVDEEKSFAASVGVRRTAINLPDGIETFAAAFDLTNWRPAFPPGNTRYRFTKEGVLIDDETKTLLRVPTRLRGHFTIPDGIRAIGPWAFRSCRLSGVTIPSSVTSIGTAAFYGSDIEEITIPDSVAEFKVDELVSGITISRVTAINSKDSHPFLDLERGIFGDCKKLKRVTLPKTMKEIPVAMFGNCGSLEEITLPDGLAGIGKCAFMRSGLKEIVIPESTRSIAKNAFYGAPCVYKVQNQYKHLME